MPKHELKSLTWVEFRERMADHPIILLPLASQEEQGPHAPMGDFMLTERVAALAAERAGALAAPTLPFGYAEFFRAIPGGIQLRADTFTRVLEDMIGAFLDHGLERILILNGHTTNAFLIDQVTRSIRRERGVAVASINLWQILPQSEWTRLHGDNAAAARGHGGDPLTSIGLALFPELMRPDLMAQAQPRTALGLRTSGSNAVLFDGVTVGMPLDVTEVTANGVMSGNPSLASAAIGAEMVEWIVSFIARLCAHLRQCDPRAVSAPPQAE
jgi:creatinine amidohydrolase